MHSPDRQQPTKKSYRRPQLTVYGSVRELTQTKAVGARRDGGTIINRNRTG
jgi:hypothetical protein